VMKPNPLASLNHLTVPVAMPSSFLRMKGRLRCHCCRRRCPDSAHSCSISGARPPRTPACPEQTAAIVRAKAASVKRLSRTRPSTRDPVHSGPSDDRAAVAEHALGGAVRREPIAAISLLCCMSTLRCDGGTSVCTRGDLPYDWYAFCIPLIKTGLPRMRVNE